jgi:hypothetical protein
MALSTLHQSHPPQVSKVLSLQACHYIIQVLSSYCHCIISGVLEWWA